MCYKSELIAFKATFKRLAGILGERQKFVLPLSAKEADISIHFAGQYYNGSDIPVDQKLFVHQANIAFRQMQRRCPKIMGCDMSNLEYPFTVWIDRYTGAELISPTIPLIF